MTWPRRVLIVTVLGAVALGCSGKTGSQASTATTPPAAGASATTAPGSATGATSPPTVAGISSPTHALNPNATTKVAPVVTTVHGGTVAPGTTVAPGPPPAETGKGAIAGHVYLACGGPPSGGACQTRLGVAGDTVMVKSGDSTVATAVSAADGSYRIDLPAGLYGLEETRGRQSTRVQVDAGHIVVADFSVT